MDENIRIELTTKCWRCDRKAITLDEKRRPLCARHAMIFVSAPRIMEAQKTEADGESDVPSRPKAASEDPDRTQSVDLPFEDRRGGGVEISLSLFRIFPEQAARVVEEASTEKVRDASAAPVDSPDRVQPTVVRHRSDSGSDARRLNGVAVDALTSESDSTPRADDNEPGAATSRREDEPVCAYAGRPVPSQWRRIFPRPR